MKKLKDMRSIARGTTIKGLVAITLAAGLICGFGSAAHGQSARGATYTNLTVDTKDVGGRTVATLALSVAGDSDGNPTGPVTLMDGDTKIAGAALGKDGTAKFTVEGLAQGEHAFTAVYAGDSGHAGSNSDSLTVEASTAPTPDFALAISATTMTIAAPGDSGSMTATVTPVVGTTFTGFISLSCSGPSITSGAPGGTALPVGVSCTFTPANLQVVTPTVANPTGAVSANLTLVTTAGQQNVGRSHAPNAGKNSGSPLTLAILLPGAGILAYLAQKRKFLGSKTLLLLLGVVTIFGATGCNPRYKYLNHGPTFIGTIPGSYTITVTAQTSNGVTASEHSQTFALTVNQ